MLLSHHNKHLSSPYDFHNQLPKPFHRANPHKYKAIHHLSPFGNIILILITLLKADTCEKHE
jgi:hypothetical protein